MPLYDFQCKPCNTQWERLARYQEDVWCPRCSGPADRLISRANINPDYEPYYDRAIDGWVGSRAHRREIMRRHDMQECG